MNQRTQWSFIHKVKRDKQTEKLNATILSYSFKIYRYQQLSIFRQFRHNAKLHLDVLFTTLTWLSKLIFIFNEY